ncbi:unnamed protein product [Orchesella dallaii]|uniref:Transmembrane protein n=1 Tax=Orchesella dallaii TaxID=48710 RepID=A0ABP1Q5M6_9HEXA
MDQGPFLDPFHLTNPCCCCCGVVSIQNGVKTVATVEMAVTAGYGIMGIWFAFNALVPSDHALIKEDKPLVPSKPGSSQSEVTLAEQHDNLVEVLLICAITSILGGSIRFLSSLFLMRSLTKESKIAAKVWVFVTYALVIIVTSVVLAVSQKNNSLFKSMTIKIFLCYAAVDFILLLYFLWVIIVYVKEAIDMPGL